MSTSNEHRQQPQATSTSNERRQQPQATSTSNHTSTSREKTNPGQDSHVVMGHNRLITGRDIEQRKKNEACP